MSTRAVLFICLLLARVATAEEPRALAQGAVAPPPTVEDPAIGSEGPDGLHLSPVLQPTPDMRRDLLMAQLGRLEASGRRLKIGGIVMLALGIALELGGQVMVLHSQLAATQTCDTKLGVTSCSTSFDVAELGVGVALGVVGAGLLYGGPSLMSAGALRIRRARLFRANLVPQISQQQFGLKATIVF